MQTHELIQGTKPWEEFRKAHFPASEAPAMLGLSPYKTRTELLHEHSTGITKDIDASTQYLFDEGHRFEALARPLGEEIVGQDLYPVTGSEGKLSASFDGLTIDESICFEHKSLNASIKAAQTVEDLGAHLHIQMEQQLMISGASKCLFMASKWDDKDQLIEEKHFWYESNQELRTAIVQGWAQFAVDLAAYVPVEVIPAAVAAPTMNLPAVSVQVQGSIALISNLHVFGDALKGFISNIPENPSTDQEFADCKSAIGKLKDAEEALDAAEANALGQIATFDEMRRSKEMLSSLARTTRLVTEKLVAARESAIKIEVMQGGKDKLAEHVAALNKRLGKPYMPTIVADFASAIKGKRTVSSIQNAVDTLLSQKKIEASAAADKIEINLNSLRELAKDHAFLFADTDKLIMKANDDLVILINSRINEHKAAEATKLEAERVRIQKEEEAKAKAAQDKITAEAETARAASEAKAAADAKAAQHKIDAEAEAQRVAAAKLESDRLALEQKQAEVKPVVQDVPTTVQIEVSRVIKTVTPAQAWPFSEHARQKIDAPNVDAPTLASKVTAPTRDQIIFAVALHFKTDARTATGWIANAFDAALTAA